MSRGRSAIIAAAAFVLVVALALEWRGEVVRSGAGHREGLLATSGDQGPVPRVAVRATPSSASPARVWGTPGVLPRDRSLSAAGPPIAKPRRDPAELAETGEDGEDAYLAIGEPMVPEFDELVGRASVAIGAVRDADAPDALVSDGHPGEPLRQGASIDADASMTEPDGIATEPTGIGEPLDADGPD